MQRSGQGQACHLLLKVACGATLSVLSHHATVQPAAHLGSHSSGNEMSANLALVSSPYTTCTVCPDPPYSYAPHQ